MAKYKDYRKIKKEILSKSFGGKCCICGYDKLIKGLDFHHTDGDNKDFSISQSINVKWSKLLKEVKKCILVCCRCHREIHEGMHDVSNLYHEIDYSLIEDAFIPNNGREKKVKVLKKCQICDEKTYRTYCSAKCSSKSQEVVVWNDEDLIDKYINKKIKIAALARLYNVSFTAVKKRLKKLKVFKVRGSII